MFRHVILETLPGNSFNYRGEDGGSGIAISHPAAGTPAANAGRRAEGQRILQRDGGRLVVRIFAQVDVVETRCVFHQVNETHRISCLPWIGKSHLGHPLSHRIRQLESAFLLQLEYCQSCERFRNGSDAKKSLGGYWFVGGNIRFPDARDPLLLVA